VLLGAEGMEVVQVVVVMQEVGLEAVTAVESLLHPYIPHSNNSRRCYPTSCAVEGLVEWARNQRTQMQ